ncbi:hypothetical protein [uncultured Desulfovibrio sp.]|nr:hypothetical protein [uncultured Desulfovibrio sp.]
MPQPSACFAHARSQPMKRLFLLILALLSALAACGRFNSGF